LSFVLSPRLPPPRRRGGGGGGGGAAGPSLPSGPVCIGGTSRGSPPRTPQQADPATAAARPDRPRRRSNPRLLHHRCPADPRPLLRPAPPQVHPQRSPPARGPPLPHRHGHRAVTPAQEPPGLPPAPLRHRRVGLPP